MNYEKLFYRALYKIISNNGGSLSDALTGIIRDIEEEQAIRKELRWDED